MSKAFVRDSDDAPEEELRRPPSPLPAGTKNYLTPGGARRLREELTRLTTTKRPALAASPGDGAARRERQAMDNRIRHLERSLRSAEVISPPTDGDVRVRFGATVTVRDRNGAESSYRIVGLDEAEPEHGAVSWQSPIARALLNARPGQRVDFTIPSGQTELEILRVVYEQA